MRVLNDYYCIACGRTAELLVDNAITMVACPGCGESATKVRAVPNFQLPGNDKAGFPTAYDKWEKKRNEKMALERKQEPS